MGGFDELLDRLEVLLSDVEGLDGEPRQLAFELLDGVDTIHRLALHRLAERLGPDSVQLRMSGACAGFTASAVTLQSSIDEALGAHMPGFVRTEVEEDTAPSYAPPAGPVPVQLQPRPA